MIKHILKIFLLPLSIIMASYAMERIETEQARRYYSQFTPKFQELIQELFLIIQNKSDTEFSTTYEHISSFVVAHHLKLMRDNPQYQPFSTTISPDLKEFLAQSIDFIYKDNPILDLESILQNEKLKKIDSFKDTLFLFDWAFNEFTVHQLNVSRYPEAARVTSAIWKNIVDLNDREFNLSTMFFKKLTDLDNVELNDRALSAASLMHARILTIATLEAISRPDEDDGTILGLMKIFLRVAVMNSVRGRS